MPELTIGKIKLNHGLMLAPMAGVTDYAFRQVCRSCGAEYTISEMVSAKAIHYGDKSTFELCRVTEAELPMAVQLFGSEPGIMAEAAVFLENMDVSPSAIDINMGCPVRKVVSNGEGSALMRDMKKAEAIIKAVVKAVKLPVTVKFRSGWDGSSINAPEFARMCEAAGVSLICIHGRTRAQMYAPPVNLNVIAAVKRAVRIPVAGNGGINTVSDALEMLEKTGCDGLMLARGVTGNPWLFSEIIAALDGREFAPPPLNERLKTALEHMEALIADKGEKTGVLEARRQLAYYIRGVEGAAFARGRLNAADTFEEMKEIVSQLTK